MKAIYRINQYIVACFAIATFILTGCQDDELFNNGRRIEEGIPTLVSLGYVSQESTLETRAARPEEYENRIENIYLFVFNSAGQRQPLLANLDGTKRESNVFRFNGGLNPDDENVSLGTGSLEFVCGSLNDATIVAIANVTEGNTATAYTVTPNELDAIDNLTDLRTEIMSMDVKTVDRGALFMMTGYAENSDGTTNIDIVGNESGSGSMECTLKLRRTDAKVEVKVKAEAADAAWTDFTFTPTSWRVVNVPQSSLILPDEGLKDAEGTYFSTSAVGFESNTNGVHGFVFYMPENLKTPKKQIAMPTEGTDEEKQAAAYALREKWITEEHTDPTKPGQTVQNIAFEYANDNSTYLELTGELSYKDNGSPVEATTRYYIHLGYAKQAPNDYLTRRNYHYTYNITVQGVDKILLEVENDQDERPGHEGDVIYSQHAVYNLDCHYDRCLLEIKPSDIIPTGDTQTTWSVSTPFCSGVYDPTANSFKGVEDYRWIKFAINKLNNKIDGTGTVGHGEYVKYPGDGAYDKDFMPTESTTNNDLPKLLDIHQLLAYLKILKNKGDDMASLIPDNNSGDGHICITAFVDEFVYIYDPTSSNETKDLSLWKKFVNQPNREMHILSEGKKYSADGNSSVTHSLYSFSQQSIKTFYNPDVATTAWGLESVMETDRLPVGDIPSEANDMDNGRANTLKWITGKHLKWTDVLNTSDQYALNSQYENALYACILRNRDLDGDNEIDPEEIRWYLASINQLTDMYIGEYAIDVNSRLYPWDPTAGEYPPNGKVNNIYWHYTSSTYQGKVESWNNSYTYPYVVWAEEGPSKGNYDSSSKDNCNGKNYAYRCVRNLGIDIDEVATSPDDFIEVVDNGDSYTFDLSKLNPQALRDYYVAGAGTYVKHNEKSSDNRPYKKFEVGKGLYVAPTRNNENINYWTTFQTTNPCSADDYRVPNLRELLIFMTRKGEELKEYWKTKYGHEGWFGGWNSWLPSTIHICSYTLFSMNDFSPYSNDRNGYSYNASDGSMGPANNQGYTCGVRDVNE